MFDAESRIWLRRLRADGTEHNQAVGELRDLLLAAARFEVRRRSATMPHLRGGDHDDLAHHSADDALVAILAKLDDFRGESRFTTWAYKFALFEASVKLRRRAWQGREVPLEPDHWSRIGDHGASLDRYVEHAELLRRIAIAIDEELTAHQREILLATTVSGVPIDVLADRLNTTRGALYKSVHDARRKLRACLAEQGLETSCHANSATP
jgi:RNA polymerase sigma-70 factor (ECF subfamily)